MDSKNEGDGRSRVERLAVVVAVLVFVFRFATTDSSDVAYRLGSGIGAAALAYIGMALMVWVVRTALRFVRRH